MGISLADPSPCGSPRNLQAILTNSGTCRQQATTKSFKRIQATHLLDPPAQ